jgi:hypothetical protein
VQLKGHVVDAIAISKTHNAMAEKYKAAVCRRVISAHNQYENTNEVG